MGKRLVAAALVVVLWSSAGSAVPASAGGLPDSFNDAFTSFPVTVNGDYIPLQGDLDCAGGPGTGELAIIWYAPGASADWMWRDLAAPAGQLTYTSSPLAINGTYEPFVGDFDGDGCDDVFWYAPGPGADFIWYGTASGWDTRPTTVNGSYDPLVGDYGGDGADDIFWYADEGGTESIWLGDATRGVLPKRTAPQVSGVGYRTVAADSAILFHRPGAGADWFWDEVVEGAAAPGSSAKVVINLTYEPHFIGEGLILLYAPGPAGDKLVYGLNPNGTLQTIPGTINGTYRVASGRSEPIIVFHAPGPAPDYIWALGP